MFLKAFLFFVIKKTSRSYLLIVLYTQEGNCSFFSFCCMVAIIYNHIEEREHVLYFIKFSRGRK